MKDMMWGYRSEDLKEGVAAATVESKALETTQNRIYFYSEIDRQSTLTLNKNLRDMHNAHISNAQIHDVEHVVPIKLHINSYGGTIFHGLAVMDEIIKINKRVEVHTIIDGCCASAATLFSVVGKCRYINKHAFALIHQLSSRMWGKYDEFQDEMKNLDKLMETIKAIYLEHTKIPIEKLDEMLKHDLWFSAEESLEYGLVDEII